MMKLSMRTLIATAWISACVISGAVNADAAGKTELTWFGHAAFQIKTPSGKVLLVDPWITNPANAAGKEQLAKIDQADLILVTHGHSDHVGNSVEIAKKTGAKLVATFDLGRALKQVAGYPAEQAGMQTMGNFGGKLDLLDGEVQIAFVPAIHSSGVAAPEGSADKENHYGGNPGGFVITVKNGPAFYHTGDTDVFGDMSLIPQHHKIDVMLACIGGHFTMGPERAAEAVKLIKPAQVVPMHFGTFPILAGKPSELEAALKARKLGAKVHALKVGETIQL